MTDKKEVEKEETHPEKEPQKQVEFKQNFPFKKIENEIRRTYIFPNSSVPVDNVVFFSEAADGSHRLLTKDNLSRGIRIASGWTTIIYQGNPEKVYEFTE